MQYGQILSNIILNKRYVLRLHALMQLLILLHSLQNTWNISNLGDVTIWSWNSLAKVQLKEEETKLWIYSACRQDIHEA